MLEGRMEGGDEGVTVRTGYGHGCNLAFCPPLEAVLTAPEETYLPALTAASPQPPAGRCPPLAGPRLSE